ncbi:MAG: hypothetical protein K0R28_4413 [Paenibacillus sp.]|nr:hypothetical protein [Paenibacillus sp.]
MERQFSRRKLFAVLGTAGVAAAAGGLLSSGEASGQGAVTQSVYGGTACKEQLRDAQFVTAATIAELRAMTDPCDRFMYYVTDPDQEGMFYCDPLDTVSADNTGTVLVSVGGQRFKRFVEDGVIHADWFGAKGDGVTNDTAAVQAAFHAVGSGQTLVFGGGKSYSIKPYVQVAKKRIRVSGYGARLIANGNIIFSCTDIEGVTFEGLTFDSLSTGTIVDTAIRSLNHNLSSGLAIRNCTFGRTNLTVRDGTIGDDIAEVDGVTVENCTFRGDYTGSAASDSYNVCDFRGVTNLRLADNRFDVVNPYRLVKISDGCRKVYITGNTFKGTMNSNKQCIDCFTDTREVVLTHNVFDLSGNPSSCFENKTGDNVTYFAQPSSLIVSGNVMKMNTTGSSVTAVGIYAAWGLPWESLPHASAIVSDNQIEIYAPNSYAAPIRVRGLNSVRVSGNDLYKGEEVTAGRCIEAFNCETCEIVGNYANFGVISIGGNATNQSAIPYAKQPRIVAIKDNTVLSFKAFGGVYVALCTALEQLTVQGNSLNSHKTDYALVEGHVYATGSTIGSLVIQGNTGFMGPDKRITLASSSASRTNISGNDWQTGTMSWNPGTIADGSSDSATFPLVGASPGDRVTVSQPYDLFGCSLTAFVPSADTVTLKLYNYTGAARSFAAADWSIRLER